MKKFSKSIIFINFVAISLDGISFVNHCEIITVTLTPMVVNEITQFVAFCRLGFLFFYFEDCGQNMFLSTSFVGW